jgi:hypothetical protein
LPPSGSDPDDLRPSSFEEEEAANFRRHLLRQALRWALLFGALFAMVFFAFWWSGAAIRFGASRVADRPEATWRIVGTVRGAATHDPVPWASIDDDPSGQPPFFHADADQSGVFEFLTLPEPHRVRVSAPGYRTTVVDVGRVWFLWLPHGRERRDVLLYPE